MAEQVEVFNQFWSKYSLNDLKKSIRDEVGESWYEENNKILLQTVMYNKYLVLTSGTIQGGYLYFWFEDSEILYYGHSLYVETDELEIISTEIFG